MIGMPYSAFNKYAVMVANISAEERLSMGELIMTPKMKKPARRKVWQRLKRETKRFLWKARTDSHLAIAEKIKRGMLGG